MKILFLSNLSDNKSCGPNWSVPARIKHQEMVDDVLWVNCTDAYLPHWATVKCFHNLKEFGGKLSLSVLPEDFRNPDLVVFEDFYYWNFYVFHFELLRKKIPYVIVPRGSLTKMAQHNGKRLKKVVANFLLFSEFIKHALCVHYLTPEEYKDSTNKWNRNHLIIPNGFTLPEKSKTYAGGKGIKAIFIGRLNLYHKGLDILIEACKKTETMLREREFTVILYGELNRDYERIKQIITDQELEDIIEFGGEAFGEVKEQALLDGDLFVMTSRFEGLPMGLLEALSYGLPVLVTPGTNMADAVRNADAGWVAETSVASVSSALETILAEKDKLAEKGRNARQLAKNYDWLKLAHDFHNGVKDIMEKKS